MPIHGCWCDNPPCGNCPGDRNQITHLDIRTWMKSNGIFLPAEYMARDDLLQLIFHAGRESVFLDRIKNLNRGQANGD